MRRLAGSIVGLAGLTLACPATAQGPAADPPARSDAPSRAAQAAGAMPTMPIGADPDGGVTVAVGGTFWEGDFGAATDSRIGLVLLNARVRTGDFRFDATLPWMSIKSDGAVFAGLDGTPLVAARGQWTGPRTRDGIGDLTVGARWLAVAEDRAGVDVELGGRVKLPIASDSSHLSTEKVDYAIGAEVSKRIGPAVPNARVTYRVFGDPSFLELRNGFAVSAGSAFLLSDRTILLVAYDYAERASAFIGDAHEASLAVSTPVYERVRLNAFASAGLSRSAPDYSVGLSLSLGI